MNDPEKANIYDLKDRQKEFEDRLNAPNQGDRLDTRESQQIADKVQKIPEIDHIPDNWERLLNPGSKSDMEILKNLPEDKEAFRSKFKNGDPFIIITPRKIEKPEEGVPMSQADIEAKHAEYKANGFEAGALGALFLAPAVTTIRVVDPETGKYVEKERQIKYGENGTYNIYNEEGKRVGYVNATYDKKEKTVKIDYIQSNLYRMYRPGSQAIENNWMAGALGPKDTKTLLYETKRIFPDAERVTGLRISGIKGSVEAMKRGVNPYQTINVPESKALPTRNPASKIITGGMKDLITNSYGGAPGTRLTDLW